MLSGNYVVEKLKNYIENTERVLNLVREKMEKKDKSITLPREKVLYLINLAESYLKDAKYYFSEKFDLFTSLCCIAYSEGLIDALKFLGLIDFKWPSKRRPRVLVGGVFEILHPGHVYLLKKAKEYGEVVVVVARDETIKKLKGREPIIPERQRLEMIRSLKYVDEAILGCEGMDFKKVIECVKPDIILLGPDQSWIEKLLKAELKKSHNFKLIRLSKRYKGQPLTSTSEIVKKVLHLFSSLRDLSSNSSSQ